MTDWLVPNETEFAMLAGRPLDRRRRADPGDDRRVRRGDRPLARGHPRGARRGARPARRRSGHRARRRRPTPIDTTGAGDAFVGAFAVGLALGWSAIDAVRLGCAAAADSVTRPGTQRSFADRASAAAILAGISPAV